MMPCFSGFGRVQSHTYTKALNAAFISTLQLDCKYQRCKDYAFSMFFYIDIIAI